jgi:hypothetical protein
MIFLLNFGFRELSPAVDFSYGVFAGRYSPNQKKEPFADDWRPRDSKKRTRRCDRRAFCGMN